MWHCNNDQTVFGDDANDRPERRLGNNGEHLPCLKKRIKKVMRRSDMGKQITDIFSSH
jgi:hypothetical protein